MLATGHVQYEIIERAVSRMEHAKDAQPPYATFLGNTWENVGSILMLHA